MPTEQQERIQTLKATEGPLTPDHFRNVHPAAVKMREALGVSNCDGLNSSTMTCAQADRFFCFFSGRICPGGGVFGGACRNASLDG